MNEEIKEILKILEIAYDLYDIKLNYHQVNTLYDYIANLQKENEELKRLCDKYEEEHNTAFKLWTQEVEKIPTCEEKNRITTENR